MGTDSHNQDVHPFKPGDIVICVHEDCDLDGNLWFPGDGAVVKELGPSRAQHTFSAMGSAPCLGLFASRWTLHARGDLETAPLDDPKAAFGNLKPSVSSIPPVAIFAMGQAMQSGADKYGAFNWRSRKVNASVYYNAIQRHLMAWWDGQENDPDTAASHLGHAMAGAALILDGQSLGVLNDDRPVAGGLPAFLKINTKQKDAAE